MSNFGDELFAATIRDNADHIWPGARLRTFAPVESNVFSSRGTLGRAARTGSALSGLIWADTVALCGGSILEDVTGVAKLRRRAAGWRKFEALGVSVGPFRSVQAARNVTDWLGSFERIVLRDTVSFDRLDEIAPDIAARATLGGDLAALSGSIPSTKERSDVITVCPSAAARTPPGLLAERIQEVRRALGPHTTFRLLALSFNTTSNDEPLCEQVIANLRTSSVDVSYDSFRNAGLEGVVDLISNSSMVISERLHGAIVAYLAEVPFAIVAHHAKCADFAMDAGLDAKALLSPEQGWGNAVQFLDDSGQPKVSAEKYRQRARNAYLNHDPQTS